MPHLRVRVSNEDDYQRGDSDWCEDANKRLGHGFYPLALDIASDGFPSHSLARSFNEHRLKSA
jgi:hypothetical protein